MAAAIVTHKFMHEIEIPMIDREFVKDAFDVSGSIYALISTHFPNFQNIAEYFFSEIIQNSYDGYRALVLSGKRNPDDKASLIFKVVIKQLPDGVIVKLKDNGTGFVNMKQGNRLSFTKTKYQVMAKISVQKSHEEGMYGGKRVGLCHYIENVESLKGRVEIKNRKKAGCSIEAFFPGAKAAIPDAEKGLPELVSKVLHINS